VERRRARAGLGCDVVLDWGLWSRRGRDRLRTGARAIGARVVLCLLDPSRDELWDRLSRRSACGHPARLPVRIPSARRRVVPVRLALGAPRRQPEAHSRQWTGGVAGLGSCTESRCRPCDPSGQESARDSAKPEIALGLEAWRSRQIAYGYSWASWAAPAAVREHMHLSKLADAIYRCSCWQPVSAR
jgi:hypothetical protein